MHLAETYLRDIRDGDRALPLWIVLALPPALAAEVLRACLAEVELLSSGQSPERHHRQLVARVGELSAALDSALADGVLSDRERADLASRLRGIAARAEQAARDLSTGAR